MIAVVGLQVSDGNSRQIPTGRRACIVVPDRQSADAAERAVAGYDEHVTRTALERAGTTEMAYTRRRSVFARQLHAYVCRRSYNIQMQLDDGVRKMTSKPWLQLRFDYDTTIPRRIRLQRKWSKLRFAFDSTAIRLRQDYDKKLTCSFFARVESGRMEAGARDTS